MYQIQSRAMRVSYFVSAITSSGLLMAGYERQRALNGFVGLGRRSQLATQVRDMYALHSSITHSSSFYFLQSRTNVVCDVARRLVLAFVPNTRSTPHSRGSDSSRSLPTSSLSRPRPAKQRHSDAGAAADSHACACKPWQNVASNNCKP
jgi:hypothetical protein